MSDKPIVITDRSINVSKPVLVEALNHTYPDLKIPANATIQPYGEALTKDADGFNIRWTERS